MGDAKQLAALDDEAAALLGEIQRDGRESFDRHLPRLNAIAEQAARIAYGQGRSAMVSDRLNDPITLDRPLGRPGLDAGVSGHRPVRAIQPAVGPAAVKSIG